MNPKKFLITELFLIVLLLISLFGSLALVSYLQRQQDPTIHSTFVPDDWTVMVYVDADNNLDSYGVKDINEMEDGFDNAVASSVNVIAMIDRYYSGATTYDIKTTLKAFIKYCITNFPAEKYALICWDHGGGILGACWDDHSSNDKLTFDEIDSAITEACSETGESTIDILGFDACLMHLLEMDYEIREHVDYLVASEETEPGNGWPYHLIIDHLCDNPSQSAQTWADQIVDDYDTSYGSGYDVTLSAVDLTTSSINLLMTAFNEWVADLQTLIPSQQSAVQNARATAQEFYYDELIDLKDFAQELKSRVTGQNYKDSCDRLINNISSAVVDYMQQGLPGAYGIAIYFPATAGDYSSTYNSIDLAEETDWDNFLNLYYYGPSYNMELLAYSFNDSVGGNGDGILDQGETINVSITLKNTGTEIGNQVNGTLSSPDGNVTVTAEFRDYGTINVGNSKTLEFQFNISSSAPNGYSISLTFIINATFASGLFQRIETITVIINQSGITGGDSFENAELITPGIYEGNMLGPDPLDGSAWFKISVPEGKYLITTIIIGAGDFDIYLYSADGTFLVGAIKSTYPDSCSTYAFETGFFRIRIYPYSGSGTYTLNVTISDHTGPEDGLSIGTAISLSEANPSAQGNCPAATSGGEMYFRIFMTEGQRVTFSLRGDSDQNDFDLSIYDYLLNELDYSWSYSYPEKITWTATYTGYHYLIVWVWSGSGDFTIEASFGGGGGKIPFGGWWILLSIWIFIGFGFIKRHKRYNQII
ncbi:MAG: clostripain-related cysteine peptidase [Candidatus Helarchaeota archaeon]